MGAHRQAARTGKQEAQIPRACWNYSPYETKGGFLLICFKVYRKILLILLCTELISN